MNKNIWGMYKRIKRERRKREIKRLGLGLVRLAGFIVLAVVILAGVYFIALVACAYQAAVLGY